MIVPKTAIMLLIVVLISALLFFLILVGRIAPKLAFLLIICFWAAFFSYSAWFNFSKKSKIELSKPAISPVIDTSIVTEKSKIVANPILKEVTPQLEKQHDDKMKDLPKAPKKFLSKIKISGINNLQFIQKFETASGYSHSKKGDYAIEFSYDGTIKKDNTNGENRFSFSGGNLVVTVGDERCCCQGLVSIPTDNALGKTMKSANQIMAKKVEITAQQNLKTILPMITACLPKY